jgi:hypothetical protein
MTHLDTLLTETEKLLKAATDAWDHECDQVLDQVKFYNSIEDLKEARTCWESCGIVEVAITEVQWVVPQKPLLAESEEGDKK